MLTTTMSSRCLPRRTEFPQSDFATVTTDAVFHDAGIENAVRIPGLSELLFSLRIIPLQIVSGLTMELKPDLLAEQTCYCILRTELVTKNVHRKTIIQAEHRQQDRLVGKTR